MLLQQRTARNRVRAVEFINRNRRCTLKRQSPRAAARAEIRGIARQDQWRCKDQNEQAVTAITSRSPALRLRAARTIRLMHEIRGFAMSLSILRCVGFTAAVLLLSPGILTEVQAAPADPQDQPAPRQTMKESCWRPGLARNIGIAEQSCDAVARPKTRNEADEPAGSPGGQPPAKGGQPQAE